MRLLFSSRAGSDVICSRILIKNIVSQSFTFYDDRRHRHHHLKPSIRQYEASESTRNDDPYWVNDDDDDVKCHSQFPMTMTMTMTSDVIKKKRGCEDDLAVTVNDVAPWYTQIAGSRSDAEVVLDIYPNEDTDTITACIPDIIFLVC